jgi:signal transduction histidine kinase
LVFSVKDTGKGIPEDKISEIFEPFYTTKDMEKGCGLGLTIVGEIVKSYNGKIDLESKLGEGTIFTIEIPLTDW